MDRLKKRSEFLVVSKTSYKWVTPAFIIQMFERTTGRPFRYGITASRKIGGAVQRNRAKRRLRALIKENLPSIALPGADYVFIARQEVLKRDITLMAKDLKHGVKMVNQRK